METVAVLVEGEVGEGEVHGDNWDEVQTVLGIEVKEGVEFAERAVSDKQLTSL